MMEVRRLLSLASDNNERFAVIDTSQNIIISNYDDFYLVKKLINKSEFLDCSMVKTGYQIINESKYWIHCSPLITSDLDNKHLVGLFISYSSYFPLWISSLAFYFFSLAMLILLLNAIWFRRLLKKRLLNPLTVLGRKIIEISRSPFNPSVGLDDIEYLPYEINEIKNAFKDVLTHLQTEYHHHSESEKKSALLDQAARVVHDIRSPIAAMETSLYLVSQSISDENIAIMKVAVQSIRDIANNILDKYRNNQQTEKSCNEENSSVIDDHNISRPILLYSLIEEITSQKRYEWMKNRCDIIFTYTSAVKIIWLDVVPSDIKRMVSNLLNNAVEACASEPKIEIYLDKASTGLELKITDNGVGMHPEKIADFLNGESTKHAGKGLGLTAAKEYMNSIEWTKFS